MSKEQSFETASSEFPFRNLLGFFLIFMGLVISFWLFSQLYSIYDEPQILEKFKNVLHHPEDNLSEFKISIGGEKIKVIVPSKVLDFLIPFGIAIIGISIASILISGGVNLLCGDLKKILFKLDQLEYKIRGETAEKKPIDEIKETLASLKSKVKELKEKKR